MPNELELCVVAAVVGALLGGGVTFVVMHKIDGAALAHEQAAHADDIARINATAAQQLAKALAHAQVAEGQVVTLTQQYDTEIAKHASDNLAYRAQLLAGTSSVRVHVAGCNGSRTGSNSAAPAPGVDGAAPGSNVSSAHVASANAVDGAVATLAPATAASVFTVVDDADDTASRLRALQAYVRTMQDDGYINK